MKQTLPIRKWTGKIFIFSPVAMTVVVSALFLILTHGTAMGQEFARTIRSANSGDPRAMDKLGIMYAAGKGVEKDLNQAKEWFDKAAASGFAPSQYNLAVLLINEEEYPVAVKWLKKAANSGHLRSFHKLGELYYEGNGVPKSKQEAFKSFLIPARAGIPASMKRIAVMMQNADGTSEDRESAIKVFRFLAELEDPESQAMLGNCYDGAIGVEKNDKLAIYWSLKAAQQGHPAAKNNMGVLLAPRMLNDNPNLDVINAFKWYNLAAAEGIGYAARQRENLRKHMTEAQIQEAERRSLQYLPRASGFNNWQQVSLPDSIRVLFKSS